MVQYKKSFFLIPFFLLFVLEAKAQIKWGEPKVVNEHLLRKNRRVLRFSGLTKPKARIRIRNNRIKITLDNGKTRTVSIPKKNAIQFPTLADKSGAFSFDLYLPTTFIQIPVEVKRGKNWKLSLLKFRVPEKGSANDLQSIEESFAKDQISDQEIEGIVSDIESDKSHYTRANEGMVIRDRHERKPVEKMALRLWAGLGTSYFLTNVASSRAQYDESGTDLVLPSWRVGGDWDFSEEFHFRANLYQGSGTTDDIGSQITAARSFVWYEFQTSVIWFSKILSFLKTQNLGLDLGFKYQSLPFFRQRCEEDRNGDFICHFSYFDSSIYSLYFGLFYKNKFGKWDYETYGRYVYPVMLDEDAFEIDSLLPINYEFGGVLRRPITKNISFGIDAQFLFLGADVKYQYTDVEASDIIAGFDLLLFTMGARFILDF